MDETEAGMVPLWGHGPGRGGGLAGAAECPGLGPGPDRARRSGPLAAGREGALRGPLVRGSLSGARWCVDLCPEPGEADLRRYREAGWDLQARSGPLAILKARTVADPEPVRSDLRWTGRDRFRRTVWPPLRTELETALALLFLLAALWLMARQGRRPPVGPADLLCRTSPLWLSLSFLCLAAGLLWSGAAGLSWWRREREGRAWRSTALSRWSARCRGILPGLERLFAALYVLFRLWELSMGVLGCHTTDPFRRAALRDRPVVMAEDLGLDGRTVSQADLSPVWALMVRGERYQETVRQDGGYQFLTCERYVCGTEGYAGRLARALADQCGTGDYEGLGTLDFQPAELGFDESWTARDGAFLLLRQGRTTALVGSYSTEGPGPDLTETERLRRVAERLEMEVEG